MAKKQTMDHAQLLVLSLLAGEDMYGYQMIVELSRRSDHTFEMKEGTLYPVLHGLETKLGNGRVYVRITLEEKGNALENGTYGLPSRRLVVMVEDNGGGIGEETLRSLKEAMEQYDRNGTIPDKKHGIGVLNAYRRLRLFYGEQAEFEITGRAGEGTCVRLAFPVKEQEEQNVSGISGGR